MEQSEARRREAWAKAKGYGSLSPSIYTSSKPPARVYRIIRPRHYVNTSDIVKFRWPMSLCWKGFSTLKSYISWCDFFSFFIIVSCVYNINRDSTFNKG
jgi:hypothetical protein